MPLETRSPLSPYYASGETACQACRDGDLVEKHHRLLER